DDEGVLIVDDPHSRHRIGNDLHGPFGFGHDDVEPFAGDDAIGFDHRTPGHLHAAVGADVGSGGAGQAQQLRHRSVHALTFEPFGDEDGAFSHGSPLSHVGSP